MEKPLPICQRSPMDNKERFCNKLCQRKEGRCQRVASKNDEDEKCLVCFNNWKALFGKYGQIKFSKTLFGKHKIGTLCFKLQMVFVF